MRTRTEYLRAWRSKNAKRLRPLKAAYARKWRAMNPEKLKAYRARWDAMNLEKTRTWKARWEKKNPIKVAKARRKSLLKTNYGLTESDYADMLSKQGGVCAICKKTNGKL